MDKVSSEIIAWFHKNGRDLPWRHTRDPYKIWLSEVILQQTRVQQGMAYYHRFVDKFPSVEMLAAASEEEVLSLWQGLGYYSRGRNLLFTARIIVENHGGIFPNHYHDLLKLRGIGPYTAAAIASFAFGENVAAVDGNVIRVIFRLFGIKEDIRLPAVQKRAGALAALLLPAGRAWDFNQAMMEFGAMQCTPAQPACHICPLSEGCESRKQGIQDKIPFKSKARARRVRFFNYLLLEHDGCFAYRCRVEKDIWQGLFEPMLFETEKSFQCPEDFFESAPFSFGESPVAHMLPMHKCILSHQEIRISVLKISLRIRPDLPGFRWVSGSEINTLPRPVIFSKILQQAAAAPLYLSF